MLADKGMFEVAENGLREQGVIDRFEAENGKITGRMMITLEEIPPELGLEITGNNVKAFCASFDFYDMMIGIAMDLDIVKPVSQFWLTPQTDDVEEPSVEWVEFFAKKLFENIAEEGFGIPMYSFVNDHSDFTAVPHKSKD